MALGASGNEVRAGGAFVDIRIKADEFKKGLKQMAIDLKAFAREVAKIGLGMTALGTVATKGFLDAAKAAGVQIDAVSKLNTVLKSTGGAAGITAKELIGFAKALQRVTTFGDEAVIEAEALLLTFTKISRDVFPEALGVILDMSILMKQGLKESIIQVGKALNDPILGVSALSRVGIQFTQTQKDMIASLTKAGRVMDAQKIILKELNVQFGGQAQAAAKKYQGRVDQLKNTFGDLVEEIGFSLIPDLLKLIRATKIVIEDFTEWVKANRETVVAVAKLSFAIAKMGALITAVSAAILLFLNPLSIVAGAIIAFSATWLDSQGLIDAGIKKLLNNFSFFGKTLSQHFETIKLKVKELVAFIQLQVAFGARRIALTLNNAIVDYLKAIENTNALTKKLLAGLSEGSALLGKNQFAQQSEEIDKLRKNLKRAREELKGFNSHVEGLNSATGVRSLTDIFQSVGAAFKKFKENLKKPIGAFGGGLGIAPTVGGGIGGVPEAGGVTGFFGSQNIREQAGAFESSTVRIGNKQLEVQRQIARDMAILRQNSAPGRFVEGVGAVFG